MKQIRHFFVLAGIVVTTLLLSGAWVSAQQSEAEAENEVQITLDAENQEDGAGLRGVAPTPYNNEGKLRTGTIVQIDEKESTKVIAATQDKIDRAFGIITSNNNMPISITNSSSADQSYVATSGRHDALVTNENGPIKSGDLLAVSALSGTLMKASVDQKLVFARALSDFDGRSGTIVGKRTLSDTDGRPHKEIGIGIIPVAIEIIKNPEEKSTKADLPEQLQRLGQAIAEKEVSPLRIYLSLAILTISIIVGLAVLYSGVRSSIISIGRNPLSKKSIFRALIEVILTSIIVLIIGLFTIYLLLRL